MHSSIAEVMSEVDKKYTTMSENHVQRLNDKSREIGELHNGDW